MQLAGDRFTTSSALFGNDLSTLPDFPAEIRAPAGTVAGVSAFQIHISDHDIFTPGDHPNVLVAMNPAALKAHVGDLEPGAAVLLNSDSFDERALQKAGYASDPRSDQSLDAFTVYEVPMTSLTMEAVKPSGTKARDAERSKNFFALGLVSWMYSRPPEPTLEWVAKRFASNEMVREANTLAFKAGWNFGETAEVFESAYEVKPAHLPPGHLHQHLGQHGPRLGHRRRRSPGQTADFPRQLPDHARPPTSCTSCPSTRTSAYARSRPKTKSPASVRRSAPPTPVRSV